jgi:hypothetical protein
MLSNRKLLINALEKLYRKRIRIDYTQGITLIKDKSGTFVIIGVSESLVTVHNVLGRKNSYHLVDAITVAASPLP